MCKRITVLLVSLSFALIFCVGASASMLYPNVRICNIGGHSEIKDGELVHAALTDLTFHGKNLVKSVFPVGFVGTYNGLTYRVNDDFSVSFSGVVTDEFYFFFVPYSHSNLPDSYILAINGPISKHGITASDVCVHLSSDVNEVAFFIIFKSGQVVDRTYYPQVELGSAATSYTPYIDPVTIPIPESIQNLPGYGWGMGDVYNEVDLVNKEYIQRVGQRPFREGDTLTDGSISLYELETPIITDISDLLEGQPIAERIPVQAGGWIEFSNESSLAAKSKVYFDYGMASSYGYGVDYRFKIPEYDKVYSGLYTVLQDFVAVVPSFCSSAVDAITANPVTFLLLASSLTPFGVLIYKLFKSNLR